MNTNELVDYYSGLLIKQYSGLPKATATIRAFVSGVVMPQVTTQTITFAPTPTSGTFTLEYDEEVTSALAWNAGAGTIQIALRLLTGLDAVTVSGSIAAGLLVTFVDVPAPALVLIAVSSLLATATPVEITVTETDATLPIAAQNAFNLVGDDLAAGDQLDVLGKYVGVSRTGVILSGQTVTLSDADFTQLIRMAIVVNNAGSSLETIQNYLQQFFAGQINVADYTTMRLSYVISTSVGSTNLIQMMITQQLLPKPMGVGLSVAVVPVIADLFAFRTYQTAATWGKPFNRYGAWNSTWRWLSYADII